MENDIWKIIVSKVSIYAPLQRSRAGNVGSGLHNVNLPAHVGPFDILVLSSEHALNAGSGSGQPPYHVVRQHDTLAGNRNLFNAAAFVKSQQAILGGTGQHAHSLTARPKDDLFRDLLPFDYLNPEPALGADVDCAFVIAIIRVGSNHYA